MQIEGGFAAEYETLRGDFNMAVGRLAEAMRTVIANAGAIDDEVRHIALASDDLSRRTERQAATMEQTAAALDELAVSVRPAVRPRPVSPSPGRGPRLKLRAISCARR